MTAEACTECGRPECGTPIRNVVNDINQSRLNACPLVVSKLIVELTIDGDPLSKQRPRFAKTKGGHVYTPKTTHQAQEVIGWSIRASYRTLVPEPDGAFAVWLHFFTKNRQRRDIDNMTKLVFDACNGIVWRDDAQVESLNARLTRESDRPRTEIEIFSIVSDTPFVRCRTCRKTFRISPSWAHRAFCSRDCMATSFRLAAEHPCGHCGKAVLRKPSHVADSGAVYCSQECKHLHESVELMCAECKTMFRRSRSWVKPRNKNHYCSEPCMRLGQSRRNPR